MNNPQNNRNFLATSLTIVLAAFAFLVVNAIGIPKGNNSSSYKAVANGPYIPTPLYGTNAINTRGPSWNDEAYADSAASIGFKIARYPGGSTSDHWDWQKGWFVDADVAAAKNMPLSESFAQMKYSPTGLKELKLLTDKANSDVLFELNMLTSDVNDQIEMLKHAREMGFRIKWLELGNEFNIPKSEARTKFPTAQSYGEECERWAQAIKQTFPDVKIGVIGGNQTYNADVKQWNSAVLNVAPSVDAIVAHVYPFPAVVVDDNGINFENVYDEFKKQYDLQGFDDVTNRGVWFTEYNIHWAVVKPGPEGKAMQNNTFTWGQALAIILMTSEATTLPGEHSIIVDHGLGNWRAFASVEERNGGVQMLPNGIGFRAWCRAAGNSTTMRKISFENNRGRGADDYDIDGWDFKGNNGNTYLVTNFTSESITVDISALNANGKANYKAIYADKTKTINQWSDVTHETMPIQDHKIILPPYSIVTL